MQMFVLLFGGGGGSKPFFETLTLLPRYFKPKVFRKMTQRTHFGAKMVVVMLAQLKISDNVLGKSWSHVAKTIGCKFGIKLNHRTFWQKFLFHTIDIKMFEFKHPNITERRHCPLNWDKTAQWQQSKDNFTLAGSKFFFRSHSVASWHQKCVPGFLTEITFIVRLSKSPTAICKNSERFTVNSIFQKVLLFIETTSRRAVVDIRYQLNIRCTKQCKLKSENSNTKKKVSLSQLSFRILFLQKFTTTEQWNLESDVWIEKHKSENPIQIFYNFCQRLEFSDNFSLFSWQWIHSKVQ